MYDCSSFRAEGYQILRGLLPRPVIAGVHDFLLKAMRRTLQDLAYLGIDPADPAVASRMAQQIVATRPDLDIPTRITLKGHFPLRDRLARELWTIPRNPGLRA